MIKLYMRIWAFISGGQLVWLRDHDGAVALSIARKNAFGEVTAKRWWPYEIGSECRLLDDGTVKHAYTEKWVKA